MYRVPDNTEPSFNIETIMRCATHNLFSPDRVFRKKMHGLTLFKSHHQMLQPFPPQVYILFSTKVELAAFLLLSSSSSFWPLRYCFVGASLSHVDCCAIANSQTISACTSREVTSTISERARLPPALESASAHQAQCGFISPTARILQTT